MDPTERFSVSLGERGRLVLLAQLRRRLDLHPGDRLIIRVDDAEAARVVSARELVRSLRGPCCGLAPERSLADELVAERREEARREGQDW